MHRVVCRELGSLEGLEVEGAEDLRAGVGEIVVEVRCAGVNYVDGLICLGRYQLRPPVPFTPGGEVAGVVSSLGPGVVDHEVGGRVVALTGFGGFSSHVKIPAASALALPANLDFGVGASFVQSYCTAAYALSRRAGLSGGESVLVLGAGGGIGLASVDLCVAYGAHVVAAASTPDKRSAARLMGAEDTVSYEEEDLKEQVRKITGGGVDVVVDPVGGRHSEAALRATRSGGRLCVIGFTGGIPSIPLNHVLLNNRSVLGVDWGAWTMNDPAANRELLAELLLMLEQGSLHPPEPLRRPLEDAGDVMSGLIARSIAGKVVLVP